MIETPTKQAFVTLACALNLHPVTNEAARRDHAKNLKATAEVMAAELGLPEEAERWATTAHAYDQLTKVREELDTAKARIAELEAQLEQATAPAATKKGGSR